MSLHIISFRYLDVDPEAFGVGTSQLRQATCRSQAPPEDDKLNALSARRASVQRLNDQGSSAAFRQQGKTQSTRGSDLEKDVSDTGNLRISPESQEILCLRRLHASAPPHPSALPGPRCGNLVAILNSPASHRTSKPNHPENSHPLGRRSRVERRRRRPSREGTLLARVAVELPILPERRITLGEKGWETESLSSERVGLFVYALRAEESSGRNTLAVAVGQSFSGIWLQCPKFN